MGTYACPYCGLDTPHYHAPEEVVALRALKAEKERFEKVLPVWLNRQDVLQAFRIYHGNFAYELLRPSPSPTETYALAAVELLWQFWRSATTELRMRVINDV